jgi:predicted nucleic acid-binding protein
MIVVDSSSVISLAVNCLCPLMSKLNVKFIITPKVHEEIVGKPAGSRRFALESMRIRRLLASGALVVRESKSNLSDRILGEANRVYSIKGRRLKIIHPAEAEAVALAGEIGADALLIDERTTRLLMEDPYELRELLSHRNKAKVSLDESCVKKLKGILPDIPIIRSAELTAVAYERGLLTRMHGVEDKRVLEAALSALKFSGCAITWDEIGEYQKAVI